MLRRIDNRINWAGVAGFLCIYDILAARNGWPSASRLMRTHPPAAALFVFAVANHLYPRQEGTV